MRINRQTLLKIAEDAVQARVKESRSILAAYLHGSLNGGGVPLLGDSGDIDLVFIHEYGAESPREIVRLTADITLDIANHKRDDYRAPRELRSHPWLGPAIYSYKILHDPRHFLDFAQAGLRDQYFRPSNVLGRSQALASDARRRWLSLLRDGERPVNGVLSFLEAAGEAANAIASLEGHPMPERRLLTQFFERAGAMGQPGFYTGLLELLGAGEIDAGDLKRWFSAWDEAFEAAFSVSAIPVGPEWGLCPDRVRYYRGALAAQLGSERPADALWLLLRTWTRAASLLPSGSGARKSWEAAMTRIGLLGGGLPARLEALDGYLDLIEETLDAWGRARGAEAL